MAELKIGPPPLPNRDEYPFTGTVRYRGMTIDIENLDGSTRRGVDDSGKPWSTKFDGVHYGELRGSLGTDGDKLDVYIKANPDDDANMAYVVHQNFPRSHPTKAGEYDEDKVVLGVSSVEAAKDLYLRHYNRKDFLRSVTEIPIEKFKRIAFGENKGEKVASREHTRQPAAFIRQRMREGSMQAPKIGAAACKTQGKKKRSAGMGRGLAFGKGRGPLGVPTKKKRKNVIKEAYAAGARAALNDAIKLGTLGSAGSAARSLNPGGGASMFSQLPFPNTGGSPPIGRSSNAGVTTQKMTSNPPTNPALASINSGATAATDVRTNQ